MVVGIYCRISKEKGVKDKSIEDQTKLGIEYCTKNNYEFKLFIDEGLSGTINDRPEFQKLLSEIISGLINQIWVFDDSRIQRNPEIRYLLNNNLRKYNVTYYTHLNGLVDLYNPQSELMGGIMAEFNKYFVTLSQIKVKSVLERRALGGRGWGIPPYGFNYDENGFYIQNPTEVKVVKEIYKLSLQGMGTESIARYLNEKKTPTRYNGYKGEVRQNKNKGVEHIRTVSKDSIKWAGNTVRGIIKNPIYYGVKKIKDVTFQVPPVFTIEYWEEVNYNIRVNNKNTHNDGGGHKYEYLLNGIIKCERCGRNFNGKTRLDKKDHAYYCMSKRVKGENCGNRSINIDRIENFIWNVLILDYRMYEALRRDNLEETGLQNIRTRLDKAQQRLTNANREKENVLEMIRGGALTIDEVSNSMKTIRAEIEEAKAEISSLTASISNSPDEDDFSTLSSASKYFKNMDFARRRKIVLKYIRSVVVGWHEATFRKQKVRYYVLTVNYNFNNAVEVYTNSYGLDLNDWFKVKFNSETSEVYFDYRYSFNKASDISELPFTIWEGEPFPDFGTLAPFGDSSLWSDSDLADYYGESKFRLFKAELAHKQLLLKKYFFPHH